jgi:hypothetical protein
MPDPRYTQAHREERHLIAFDLADTSYATGGWAWLGRRSKKATGRLRTFEELKRDGARLLEWNGRYVYSPCVCDAPNVSFRDPKLIIDSQGRIIVILLGTPEDPDWTSVMKDAIAWMRYVRRLARRHGVWRKGTVHHRGRYFVITAGVSFGGGQMVCLLQCCTHTFDADAPLLDPGQSVK